MELVLYKPTVRLVRESTVDDQKTRLYSKSVETVGLPVIQLDKTNDYKAVWRSTTGLRRTVSRRTDDAELKIQHVSSS